MKAARPWLRWAASALLLGGAAFLLWRQLQGLGPGQLQLALRSLPPAALACSLLATALSFACLAGYERMATQWLARDRVPRSLAWRVGLVAHALANTLGFHPVTAVALRLRSYAARGIDATTLAKIVAAIGGCVAAGVVALLAVAGAWALWQSGRGLVLLCLLLAGGGATLVLRLRLRSLGTRSALLPHLGSVLLLGLLEMSSAVAAFAVLVPAGALPDGPALLVLFVCATGLGILSHAPGGLGVFEATILAAAAPAQRAQVLAALLAYRAIYNLLPCALALLAVGLSWMRERAVLSSSAGRRA